MATPWRMVRPIAAEMTTREASPAAADRKRWVNPTKVKRYKELVRPSLFCGMYRTKIESAKL